jgi:hemoglobin/transferrin/lactoferrin receptor protein
VEAKHRVDLGPLPNQLIPGGYQTLDLTGYWQLVRHARLGLGFYNLTDAAYFNWQDVRGLVANRNDVDRFTQPGTSVRASLTLEF